MGARHAEALLLVLSGAPAGVEFMDYVETGRPSSWVLAAALC